MGRIWTAAVILFLALAGAGIGYLAGSLGEDGTELSQGPEQSASTSPTADDPVNEADLPEVLCAENVAPVTLVARTEPEECTFLRAGAPANPPGTDFTSAVDLVWTEWSGDRATADGAFIAMGRNEARFELSEPLNVCGRTVFTRIQIERPGYTNLPAGRIEGCP